MRGYVLTFPNGMTMEADFNNPRHNEAIVAGFAKVSQATFQKVRLAWYTGPHFLYDVPSPYKHNQFPYVPFFGHREDLTNVPYGLIRSMISPQDEVNARKSKMLWSLNSRRVIADADAVMDHQKAQEEAARPDAYIILNPNRKPNSQFKVEPGGELANQQFQVMQEAKEEIAQASGIHKSMMGQNSNATSGLAINSLVEQGVNTLAEINDNFRFARRLVGEMLFEMVKQNLLQQGTTKVTIGEGQQRKVIELNKMVMDPETGQQIMINDVAKVKAKIVLDEIPSTPTYRMQQLQMLSEITKSLPPELQAAVADFIIEATDFPKRHEVADRIRGVIGIQSPEQQQQMAAAQQEMAAKQQAITEEAAMAKIEETRAKTQKLLADAQALASRMGEGGVDEGAMQAQFQQQMQPLIEKIQTLQLQLKNKGEEISARYAADTERARMDAAARVESERIKAANEKMLEPLAKQIDALKQEIAMLRKEEQLERKELRMEIKHSDSDKPKDKPKKKE